MKQFIIYLEGHHGLGLNGLSDIKYTVFNKPDISDNAPIFQSIKTTDGNDIIIRTNSIIRIEEDPNYEDETSFKLMTAEDLFKKHMISQKEANIKHNEIIENELNKKANKIVMNIQKNIIDLAERGYKSCTFTNSSKSILDSFEKGTKSYSEIKNEASRYFSFEFINEKEMANKVTDKVVSILKTLGFNVSESEKNLYKFINVNW